VYQAILILISLVQVSCSTFYPRKIQYSTFSYFLVIGLIESNGWFILIGCVLIYYIYNKYKNRLSFDSINSRSFHREGNDIF
jgi:hypothetical protein